MDSGELVDVSSDSSSASEAEGARVDTRSVAPSAPAPRRAPRGLAGIFDDEKAEAAFDVSSLPKGAVLLNVYDVSDSEVIQRVNLVATANNNVLVGGVFHGGVEIFGREWSFGATEEARTGISAVWPRAHPQHTYRATVHMGNTNLGEAEVHSLLVRMAPEWLGNSYSLIHRNCLSFCNSFLQELGLRRIPGWVDRAARAASQVDRAVQLAKTLSSEEVQSRANTALHSLRRESSSALDTARVESAKLVEQTHSEVRREVAQVQAKALEIGEKAQEGMQALGATLRRLSQDLGTGELAEGPLGLANSLPLPLPLQRPSIVDASSIVDTAALGEKLGKAQEHVEALGISLWQWGQNLQKDATLALNGPAPHKGRKGKGRRRRPKATMLGPGQHGGDEPEPQHLEANADLSEVGFIRREEERLACTGLLEDSDGDGCDLPVAQLPPVVHPGGCAQMAPPLQLGELPESSPEDRGPDRLSAGSAQTAAARDEPSNDLQSCCQTGCRSTVPATLDLLTGDILPLSDTCKSEVLSTERLPEADNLNAHLGLPASEHAGHAVTLDLLA